MKYKVCLLSRYLLLLPYLVESELLVTDLGDQEASLAPGLCPEGTRMAVIRTEEELIAVRDEIGTGEHALIWRKQLYLGNQPHHLSPLTDGVCN